MAEALLNHLGRGRFRAFSAGSHPTGAVNPLAVATLQRNHLPVDRARSKSWDEFATADAPPKHFVFTVCDRAAQETCPFWPGQPMTAHWGIADPAAVTGTPGEVAAAFSAAYRMLERRIAAFASLPIAALDSLTLQARLREIGRLEGSTARAST